MIPELSCITLLKPEWKFEEISNANNDVVYTVPAKYNRFTTSEDALHSWIAENDSS